MLTFLDWITATAWFHYIAGGIIGLAGGVWLDAVMKRREEVPPLARRNVEK